MTEIAQFHHLVNLVRKTNHPVAIDADALISLDGEIKELEEALEWILECPYTIDLATVPIAGINANPEQVVGVMSMALVKHRKAKQALAMAKGEIND